VAGAVGRLRAGKSGFQYPTSVTDSSSVRSVQTIPGAHLMDIGSSLLGGEAAGA
jgi:hypothetical protein